MPERVHARGAERVRVALVISIGALGVLALGLSARTERSAALSVDERDYLAAASHLARHQVVAFSPPSVTAPPPDAYREPGYPALLAASWRLAGVVAPATAGELERFAATASAARAARGLHLALLALAAAAAGWAASRLGTPTAGALAFALVAASPALGDQTRLYAVENPATALLALASAALVGAAGGGTLLGAALAALLAGALPLVLAPAIVVAPAGALALLYADWVRPPRKRLLRPLVFLALALAPALAWMARNERALGRFVLSDRGGVALAVRAELDREVERSGALAAALAWTPFEPARQLAERRAPEARFDQPRWGAESNFFSRAVRRWREAAAVDPLARDAELRRAALDEFGQRPRAHFAATLAVGWRGLFAERSPEWVAPFDARLPIGLLLAAATAAIVVDALREGGARRAAWLAPAAALFLFHALATELLPRYAVPLLPTAWTAVALLVAGRPRGSRPAGGAVAGAPATLAAPGGRRRRPV